MRVDRNSAFITGINSNFRQVSVSVLINNVRTFTGAEIKSIKINSQDIPGRAFGVSYCHQLKITIRNGVPDYDKDAPVKVSFICNGVTVNYPTFYIDEKQYNRNTGEITFICYDLMAKANDIKYTPVAGDIDTIANGVASQLHSTDNVAYFIGNTACKPSSSTKTWTVDEINTDGSMSLRSVIKAIAEITGTIAYINCDDKLVFRGLHSSVTSGTTITNFYDTRLLVKQPTYYQYDSNIIQDITGIAHKNELNDAVTVGTAGKDCIVLFNNPFLSKLDNSDITTILTNIYNNVERAAVSYALESMGNPATELGDCYSIYPNKGTLRNVFILQETLEYNGGLKGTYGWDYAEQDPTDLPPSSVTQDNIITRATVDKVNSKITLQAQTIEAIAETAQGPSGPTAYIKIQAINDNPSSATISADKINLSGVATFMSNDGFVTENDLYTTGRTTINGGNITTGQIQGNYVKGPTGSHYSTQGSKFDLTDGTIETPYFYTGPSGAGFKGDLEADNTRFKKLSIYKEIPASDPNDPPTTWETSMSTYEDEYQKNYFKIKTETGTISTYVDMDGENITIGAPDGGISISGGPQGINLSGDVSMGTANISDLTASSPNLSNPIINGGATFIGDVAINGYVSATNIPDPPSNKTKGYFLYCMVELHQGSDPTYSFYWKEDPQS